MKLIILAGHNITPQNTPALEEHQGLIKLDHYIDQALKTTPEVVIVLAGESGDNILRRSRYLKYCELIFDTNGEQATELSNLQAALHSTQDWVIVLSLDEPYPSNPQLQLLNEFVFKEGLRAPYHIARVQGSKAYPLLVSRAGNKYIKNANEVRIMESLHLRILTAEPHKDSLDDQGQKRLA